MFRKLLLSIVAFALVFGGAISLGASQALAAPRGDTLVDVALAANASTGEFSTLIAAVLAADPAVFETLNGNGQLTVFAPTDAAFAKLGLDASNVGSLDQATLTQILLYHVVRGRRNSNAILGSSRIRTLQGGFLRQSGGVLTDNQGRTSNIIATDVAAANGLIHVIDAVVLP
ncbi:MAG: fasciclin domain-containing protein [Anaerolineae bacterium]|nr:fasciclin domain-containing protein [Anaerolineae bacterium]